jgi:hypothetical protein
MTAGKSQPQRQKNVAPRALLVLAGGLLLAVSLPFFRATPVSQAEDVIEPLVTLEMIDERECLMRHSLYHTVELDLRALKLELHEARLEDDAQRAIVARIDRLMARFQAFESLTKRLQIFFASSLAVGLFAIGPTFVQGQESKKKDKQQEDKWERWGEEQAAHWEKWAERYAGGWEGFAKTHERSWEKWANNYADGWKKWGEAVERGDMNAKERDRLFRENLEGLREMPLGELFDQVIKSTEQLHEMPLDKMQGLEDLVRESVEQALGNLEDIRGDKVEGEWSTATEAVVELLERMQGGLDKKRDKLSKVAAEELSRLESRLAEMPEGAEGRDELFRVVEKHLESMKAKRTGEGKEKAKYLDQLRKRLKASKGKELSGLAKEIAKDRRSKTNVDRELESMRAEIKRLRAELKRLRGKASKGPKSSE